MAVLDEAVVQLTEAMLQGAPNKRRARLLAVLAALGHDGQTEMFEPTVHTGASEEDDGS